jgi:hypothetical protein
MFTFDCPWCEQELQSAPTDDHVSCEACGVELELAPDPAPTITVAAAA